MPKYMEVGPIKVQITPELTNLRQPSLLPSLVPPSSSSSNSLSSAAMATPEEYMKIFKKGTIVEVSSVDEGLRGSWYTATVLRSISNKTTNNYKMLVEYHNLMADDNPNKPLREFVDAILVRPIPPRDPPSRKYRLMEDVDAFHNDGWWEGVVTKVLGSSSEGSRRYAVFFRCSREQIEFDASDLRLHREWVRGDVWVTPLDLSHSLRYALHLSVFGLHGCVLV